jgi:hypothetical protein
MVKVVFLGLQTMKFLHFLSFVGHFSLPGSRSTDPIESGPETLVLQTIGYNSFLETDPLRERVRIGSWIFF